MQEDNEMLQALGSDSFTTCPDLATSLRIVKKVKKLIDIPTMLKKF